MQQKYTISQYSAQISAPNKYLSIFNPPVNAAPLIAQIRRFGGFAFLPAPAPPGALDLFKRATFQTIFFKKYQSIKNQLVMNEKIKHTPGTVLINHWHNDGTTGVTCHGKDSDGIVFFTGDAITEPRYSIVSKCHWNEHEIQGSFEGAHVAEVVAFSEQSKANVLRIRDCWNAMEGIDDPIKMRETWEAIKTLELDAYFKMKEQRDELLEFIEKHYQFLNLDAQKEAVILIKKATE